MHEFSVLIVGAGPIGIELSVGLKRRGLASRVVDAGSLGHTISWWAPQTKWFSSNRRISIAGVPLNTVDGSKASREQYLNYLRSVVQQFDLDVQTKTIVTDAVKRDNGRFEVHTKSHAGSGTVMADAVVLAIGGTDRPNRLDIPGEDLPHVDGYLRETHQYFGRQVLVIGGRNSAIEAALRLHHAGAKVTLSYRGENLPEENIKYWMLPEMKGLIQADQIRAEFGTVPVEITPNHVVLARQDERIKIAADDVLSLIGYQQDKGLMRRCGVELLGTTQRPQFDDDTMQTNVPGIYVAGTAVAGTQSSKYKTFLENCHIHVDRIVDHLCSTMGTAEQSASSAAADDCGRDGRIVESNHASSDFEKLIEYQPES